MRKRLINVLCVDDNTDAVRVLKMLIDREPDLQWVGCLGSARALVSTVRRTKADVVLLDLSMPGPDALEMLAKLVNVHPNARVIIFSAYEDVGHVDAAINAGAWGYVSKNAEPGEILAAIRAVRNGEFVLHTHA
jgi:DNA-binding NarL/FixJ family response regulator